ncbi:hypothetical protein CDD82_4134 [Ophiocordyceps australis]|uniref:aspartyl aminopeptidase n=1 Tax=Ophiocordyceps australis TaxID=1399860 RepID=A0A2C5ZAB4_9HYPO|nr:hypothetical protein CDD82_4134 [Ophiocordyceps australis]
MAPPAAALDFVDFVNASPTPYHAVQTAAQRFEKAGFSLIRERDDWAGKIKPGGKYYLTRNASTIVAFGVGGKWRPGNPVAIVGAHTDSPCLRLKPVSKRSNVGYLQIGVETYGGGIWHSWFDRDLSVAGRVMVRQSDKSVEQRLVKVDKPLLRIPTLAIHLTRQSNFDANKETELFPIAGLVAKQLNKPAAEQDGAAGGQEADDGFDALPKMTERHHGALLNVLAEQLEIDVSAIVDFELVLYDTQKSCIGGLADELIFSPRLDNLGMTYCAMTGLLSSVKDASSLADDGTIRMAACFDHEEVGSESAQGAHSDIVPAVLRRLSVASQNDGGATAYEQMLSRSFLVSADMAHAVHPNYAAKYEAVHQPAINGGTVIKVNANQRYATNSPGIVLMEECARRAGVPLQLFVVRNDSPCGSTIGPGLAALLGMRTLDLGNPQLSMHSIRETGGTADVEHSSKLFCQFFQSYGALEPTIVVD